MNLNYVDLKLETLESNQSNDLNINYFNDSLKKSKGQVDDKIIDKIKEDNHNDFVE